MRQQQNLAGPRAELGAQVIATGRGRHALHPATKDLQRSRHLGPAPIDGRLVRGGRLDPHETLHDVDDPVRMGLAEGQHVFHGCPLPPALYNAVMVGQRCARCTAVALTILVLGGGSLLGQTQPPPVPQPFPRPSQPATSSEKPPAPAATATSPAATPETKPSEQTLGLPVYPNATFLASYDAGLGQRYYLFGSTASFTTLVGYYRGVLKQKGELVFEEPATHMFEVGKYDEELMAFPPGVTVKDYTWGGSQGYLNPAPGGKPARFPTIIQLVPAPTPAPGKRP